MKYKLIFNGPQTKFREGNAFIDVCLFTGGGVGISGPRSFLRGGISVPGPFWGGISGPRSIPGGRYTKGVTYRGG